MNEHSEIRDHLGFPAFTSSKFDSVIEFLLVALLAFMPLAFGGLRPWSEEIIIALSGAIVICFLLKLLFHRDRKIIMHMVYVPITIFVLITIIQLIPLPAFVIDMVSANTVATKTRLLSDLPAGNTFLKSITLSFYPHATRHDLRLVLAIMSVFVVVLNVFRHPSRVKRLLTAIAIIGGSIAVIAFAQNLFGNGKIYWFIPSRYSQGYSGPFTNHSHYGQFMNLSIGAAVGLILLKLREDFGDRKIAPHAVIDYFASRSSAMFWLFLVIIILCVSSVFISLTRGGMVSMLIAATFTTLMITWRCSFRGHGWVIVVMALVAFTCVLYLGFDAVYDQLASLRDIDQYKGRWQILKDLTASFAQFPLVGTGLGTHSVVYPMFDHSTIVAIATHAENEYAQVMEEMGLLGLGCLITFGIIVWAAYYRAIRKINSPIRASAYGLGFGILAILIHSLSDFGQHIPANAFLTAVFCAILLTLGKTGPIARPATRAANVSGRFGIMRLPVLLVVTTVWIWAFVGADNARKADACWDKVLDVEKSLVEKNWQGSVTEYDKLISYARAASEYEPANVKYRYWLNVYRWQSISRTKDPDTGESIISAGSMPTIHDVVNRLHETRALCPTFGATYCTLGQIERFILKDPAGAERIKKGFSLAPCDPIACFAAGVLDIEENRIDESFAKFQRAVRLNHTLFRRVINIYGSKVNRGDLAMAIAGDDIAKLNYVINVFAGVNEYEGFVTEARAKVLDLLEAICSGPDALASSFASLGDIYSSRNEPDKAVEYYYRALAKDYGHVQLRLKLAKLLAQANQIRRAMHEARICLRIWPQFTDAERLVADLSVHPAVIGEQIKP